MDFYARRIRRIFPALLVVFITFFTLGWFTLLADEFKQLSKHIAGGAGFLSNIIYWKESGYFDNSSELKPFLHLWSLAIEEQFYFVWPITLWFGWKFRKHLWLILISLIAISFFYNLSLVQSDKIASFYLPYARFWEILGGALLAYFRLGPSKTSNMPSLKNESITNNLISIAGLLFLIAAFLLIKPDKNFPGFWALLPTLGTLLAIHAGEKTWINRNFFSNKLFVNIGLISFPLYLWHWPLLSFARIIEGETPSRPIRTCIVILSFILAWLTNKFIENPFRYGDHKRIKTLILIFAMIGAGGLSFYTFKYDGLKFRAAQQYSDKISNSNDFTFPPNFRHSCKSLPENKDSGDWCNDGNTNAIPSVFLWGDSIATSYSQLLLNLNKDLKFSFKQFGRGQCPPLLNYGPLVCREASNFYFNFVKNNSAVKVVILAAQWPEYAAGAKYDWLSKKQNTQEFVAALRDTVAQLATLDKKIVIFLSPPVGVNPRKCVRKVKIINQPTTCDLPLEIAVTNDKNSRQIINEALAGYPHIKTFDPFKYLCESELCKVMTNEKIFYIDASHLSFFGSEYLAQNGKDELQELLKYED